MKDLWGLHVYMWEGALRIGANRFPIHYGSASVTPPNTNLEWYFPDHAPHYYAHFAAEGQPPGGRTVPVMQELGRMFDFVCSEFEEIIGLFPYEKLHAEVRLWGILLRLARRDLPRGGPSQAHPKVQIAMSYIENNLVRRISVEELARTVGTSQNHLTNLFKESFNVTVGQYIRRRRCRKARHLLESSSLSITSIARQVGVPDLHHFNKLIRRELGASPRNLRRRAAESTEPSPRASFPG